MSNKYKHQHHVPTEALCQRLKELVKAVIDGPDAVRREFTMSIPVELDRDADCVLIESAIRLAALESKLSDANEKLHWDKVGQQQSDERIAELESKLASMEWVSVEDRLPPFETEVLVYQPNWKGQPVTIAAYVSQDSSGYKFCFDHNTLMIDQRDFRYSVTHWKPLPPSPDITKGE